MGCLLLSALKKRADLPIIIVSAQGDDVDRIVGLEVGADDYSLSKPFNPRELLARVRQVLRRSSCSESALEAAPSLCNLAILALDLASHRLAQNGVAVPLTSGEFDLLAILFRIQTRCYTATVFWTCSLGQNARPLIDLSMFGLRACGRSWKLIRRIRCS